MTALSETALLDVLSAAGVLPEDIWNHEDDACDCTYQRIGQWSNPYIAETLEVRMCCIWKELYKLFPDAVRVTPAFLDYNSGEWRTEPQEWDGHFEMPRSIWYRQLAKKEGRSLPEIRAAYASATPPQALPEPPQPEGGPDMMAVLFEVVMDMANRIDALEARK